MDKNKTNNLKKFLRARRTRSKIRGTSSKPRLSVHRSLKHISVQLIDDDSGKTLVNFSDTSIKDKVSKVDKATIVGGKLAELAKEAGITDAVFDRGANKYHGRVKAIAEAAREAGLKI